MKTAIHKEADRMIGRLEKMGISLSRCQAFEALASAKGFKNVQAMMAAEKSSAPNIITDQNPTSNDINALKSENADLRRHNQDLECDASLLHRFTYDWKEWNRLIKSASHQKSNPLEEDKLDLLRLAVADNHCKSSKGDRSSAEHRVMELGRKFLPALIARLDKAEEMLGKSKNQSPDSASINLKNILKIEATRDGFDFTGYIENQNDDDKNRFAAAQACAKAFNIEENISDSRENSDTEAEQADEVIDDLDTFSIDPMSLEIDIEMILEAIEKGEGTVLLLNQLHDKAKQVSKITYPEAYAS